MGYEPLHHKYRPQTFDGLVGQEAIATTLKNALIQRRIAPAYLFCGPRGTGKTSSARILAKSLNCLSVDEPTATPCGTCEVCRRISNGTVLDVVEIDAASNTGVDNIRELIERAQFAPVQCRYKVYVIDECLTGDARVHTRHGLVSIDDPRIEGQQVLSFNEASGQWEYKRVTRWLDQGIRPILEIQTSRRKIRCTANHLLRTEQGWLAAREVKEGVKLLSPVPAAVAKIRMFPSSCSRRERDRRASNPTGNLLLTNSPTASRSAALDASLSAYSPYCPDSAPWTPWPNDPSRQSLLAGATTTSLPREPAQLGNDSLTSPPTPSPPWATSLETVVSVCPAGVEPVYDIEVEDNHNFVANGLLVHNCHMLSTAAFNALLKTLEEPPNHVIFVLATTDPQRVLPTIISRCQRFDFRRIPLEAMVNHLRDIAQREAIDITDEASRLVAQVAQGGLRDAESLLDQLSLLLPPITPEKVWDLVGAVPERDLLALVQAIAADDGVTVLDTARKLMDRGREPIIVLQNLAGFYRDLLIAKTASSRHDLVAVTPPTWEAMQEFVQSVERPLLLQGQQILRTAEAQLKNTTQPRLWLEVTLLSLLPSAQASSTQPSRTPTTPTPQAAPAPPKPPSSSQSAPSKPAPLPQSAPPKPTEAAPAAQPPAVPAAPTPASTNGDRQSLWAQLTEQMQPPGTRILMIQQGHLLSCDGQSARIGIRSKALLKMAQGRVPNIEAAFEKVLGHPVKVTLEVSEAPPADTATASATSPPSSPPPAAPAQTPPSSAPPAPEPPPAAQNTAPEPPPMTSPDSPAATPASTPWTPENDLDRAVKSFAEFFNGQVVPLDDEPLDNDSANDSAAADPPSSSPDRDVPF